jgi:tRNA(Ile)-lysidine synthase
MLVLAAAALPGRIEAATVDHGLRAQSGDEAAQVALVCSAIGIPHQVLKVDVANGNLQAEARNARYNAFAGWLATRELAAMATAHHADDQAETLIMRLNRGSGVGGLAGVRARGMVPGTRIPIIRPLLGWRKAELVAIAEAAGLDPAQDPSNADPRFDRARLRQALAAADWLDIPAVASSAAWLAEADLALNWAAAREWEDCVTRDGPVLTYCPKAPKAIALRVLNRIVLELDGDPPRGSATARLIDALVSGKTASIGNLVARPMRGEWSFTPAPKRRS